MPTQTYFELLEAFEREATHPRARHICPVCALALAAVQSWLEQLSLENVNDFDTRAALRGAGGFCNRHSWAWARLHDALGTAILYEDLLREAERRIERGDFAPRRTGRWGRGPIVAAEGVFAPCPLCQRQAEAEERILDDFAEGFADQPRFRQAYAGEGAAGLCLSHYRGAVLRLEGTAIQELGQMQRQKFARTRRLLHSIIEKMDAGRKLEAGTDPTSARTLTETERESLERAIWQMTGLENLT